MDSKPSYIRLRLGAMMFIEFFLWASWYVPLSGYANSTLKFTGAEVTWLYATTAIGAIVSPLFVGFIADRFFATEQVLGVLHFLGAVCLFLAAKQTEFAGLMGLLVVNALCFMPTLGLANSLAFRNIDDPEKFSRVAVWGTIGWIISGLAVGFLVGGRTNGIFYVAAGGGVAMAAYSLYVLPHTPPKGAGAGDVLGLGALKLLKEPAFLVFALCAFLISIPLSFYFSWGNAFLTETDRPNPTALQTLCQVSEIVVMVVMPWFIGRIGLKNVIVIGMAAWAVRYVCFASLSFPLILIGLLVHGFCYCFVFVASFIYADKKAPPGMSASAQSFVAFLIWGLGMFIGTKLSGYTADKYPAPGTIAAAIVTGTEKKVEPKTSLPDWKVEKESKWLSVLPEKVGSKDPESIAIALLDALPDEGITLAKTAEDGKVTGSSSYAKKDLLDAFKAADQDKDNVVTYAEWREAQSHVWPPIWLWPAALSAFACLVFLAGGREPKVAPQPN